MRFLKNKILKSECLLKNLEIIELPLNQYEQSESTEPASSPKTIKNQPKRKPRFKSRKVKCQPGEPGTSPTKNIIKNYGQAICKFMLSDLARPYLEDLCMKYNLSTARFIQHICDVKDFVKSVQKFKSLLLVQESDMHESKALKNIFQELAIIFMTDFSVNWIFSGRVFYKDIYLRVRHKMLRRIKHPELFRAIDSI